MAKVAFAFAHPDDEVLNAGVSIAEHVAAGHDVHVIWVTRGAASGARNEINGVGVDTWWHVAHDPIAEGYVPLDTVTFGSARIAEAMVAVRALVSGLGEVTFHELGLLDGGVISAVVQAGLLSYFDVIAPNEPVRLKSHTWVPALDDHPDHTAVGSAIKALGDTDPVRFGDRRYYILPAYWTDPGLSLVSEVWDTPSNAGIRDRVINACRAFQAWHPPHSYAIGMTSTGGLFNTIMTNPRSLFHA